MKAAAPSSTALISAVGGPAEQPESLRGLLASHTFERAPALRALLGYLWQHRDEPISEYAIATEALGRSSFFDAKTDATVRVQISRLRQRLEKFYEGEGAACNERIIIPLGSHQIRIETIAPVWTEPEPAAPELAPLRQRAFVYLAAACGILFVLCVGFAAALLSRRTPTKVQPAAQEAGRFWKSFFGNGRPTRIILPTPVFFAFHGLKDRPGATIMLRDTELNEYAKRQSSEYYRILESKLGASQLASNYTVSSDTFAAVRLARYLDRLNLSATVLSSADAPMEALDNENVIAVGTWGTLAPLQPYLDRMNYVLGPHESSVLVRNPAAGEPKQIELIAESEERSIWPGVVAVLPGRGGRTHLLVLASRHTSALISFLTSTNGLDQWEHLWKASGSPEYYETVVNAEMNGATLVRFWPVALRPYRP